MTYKFALNDYRTRPSGKLGAIFSRFAQSISHLSGHPAAFMLAVMVILAWAVTGPLFHFSDTWQLVINTGTTIVTFLIVFLIQNTQNRDTLAIQIKLSELVLAMKGAKNKFAAIEDLTDAELEALHEESRMHVELAMHHLSRRRRARARSSDMRLTKPLRKNQRQKSRRRAA